jgi:type IV pilus assembly protein PilV
MHKQHTPEVGAPKKGQRGASMIELLVSILIFAFGMLGLVGLQTRTLSYGQFSLYRSQATALTDDILDRMRADRASAKAGNWNTLLANASTSITGTTTIAETDLKEWKQQVEALLPLGKGQVNVTAGVVTITMTWDERGTAQPPFVTTSGL